MVVHAGKINGQISVAAQALYQETFQSMKAAVALHSRDLPRMFIASRPNIFWSSEHFVPRTVAVQT